MANPLTAGTLQVTVQARISGANIAPQGTVGTPTIASPAWEGSATGQQTFSFGTTSGKCDILCMADYSLAASGGADAVTIDLYANGLPNVFGGDADFRKLRAVTVAIVSGGDAAGVTIGNAASNAHQLFFGADDQTWTIYPSGTPLAGSSNAGVTVDATHRNVLITNNSAVAVVVRVAMGGTSV